jgi:hypothetical protein
MPDNSSAIRLSLIHIRICAACGLFERLWVAEVFFLVGDPAAFSADERGMPGAFDDRIELFCLCQLAETVTVFRIVFFTTHSASPQMKNCIRE